MPPPVIDDFENRLSKNVKHLRKWAKREGVSCWRAYDKDLHEYAVAVDLYEGNWVHVSEYEPPPKIDDAKARARLDDVMKVIPKVFDVPADRCFLKVRRRMKEGQYEKLGEDGPFHEVHEGRHTFLVNFTDYLDTGLFLDHRITRALLQERAAGKTFLNLFAYTGTATVYAAKGGATSTTTVDLSNTYLDWAARNFALNGVAIGETHELVRADCTIWVPPDGRRFDLIFLDPPTFSSSKKMRATFDVQRDHVAMLKVVSRWLAPGGAILFSNNFRRFKLDASPLPEFVIEDISKKTIPEDFRRNERIHHAWWLTHK